MPRTADRRPGRLAGARLTVARAGLAGLLAVLAVPLAGAGSAEQAVAPGGAQPAFLRTAHLLTGLGTVDVRLSPFSAEGDTRPRPADGALARTASSGAVDSYSPVAPGTYAVTVRLAEGGGSDDEPLLSGTVTLAPGLAYTVVALGPAGAADLRLLEDDLTPPPAGQSEVRLFSAVPRARVALDGGAVAEQVPPSPDTGYVPVPAGDRVLEVTDGVSSTSLRVGLDSRSSYTVFVRSGPGGALGVRAVLDQAATEQAPVGGVDTGGGFLATQPDAQPSLTWPAATTTGATATTTRTTTTTVALLAAGLALAAAALRARRPDRPATAGPAGQPVGRPGA